MSLKELMQGKVSTKFMVTILALMICGLYFFFGPQKTEPSAVGHVSGIMEKVVLAYIAAEGLKAVTNAAGEGFGKKGKE